jgi:glycosyltransferase involved in cell wall biosynthesis
MVHLVDHPSRGGASRAAFRIHETLLGAFSSDSKLFWFSHEPADLARQCERLDGTPRFFRSARLNRVGVYFRHILKPGLRLLFDFLFSRNLSLEKRLAEEMPSWVIVHWVQPRYVPARSLRRFKVPIAVVLHDARFVLGLSHYPGLKQESAESVTLSKPEWFASRIVRWALRRHQITLICPSRWIREVAVAAGWPDEALTTIPYPLDTDFWRPHGSRASRPGKTLQIGFGFSGNNAGERKGEDVFAAALTLLLESQRPLKIPIQIVFFGDAVVPVELSLTNHSFTARAVGHLDDSALRKTMSQLDLMVLPSRQENLAQIALEAQACEIPIIVADKTGLESAVIPGAGWTFTNGSPEDLANVLVAALEDPTELRRRGRLARAQAIQLFSATAISRLYFERFKKIDRRC